MQGKHLFVLSFYINKSFLLVFGILSGYQVIRLKICTTNVEIGKYVLQMLKSDKIDVSKSYATISLLPTCAL